MQSSCLIEVKVVYCHVHNVARDTGVVATCGGDTVCLIDCGTGQVMKRFKQQKEVCMSLAYVLLLLVKISIILLDGIAEIAGDNSPLLQTAWQGRSVNLCIGHVCEPCKKRLN